MKFAHIVILLCLFFVIASTKNSAKSKSALIAESLTSSAQTYAPFARLAYCPRAIISDFKCEFCNEFAEDYATYFIHSAMYNNNRLFQLVVVYSDTKREIVISFSGPKTALKEIYESGYVMIPELGNIKMEREFWEVYSLNFRQVLSQKIQQITESGRGDYTFIFLGHSAGGSLATLAAYDMVNSNVVIKTVTSPKVYTYGQLSIGDDKFVKKVNKVLKVVRIVKHNDYVARSVKTCNENNGRYVCTKPHVRKVSKYVKKIRVPSKYRNKVKRTRRVVKKIRYVPKVKKVKKFVKKSVIPRKYVKKVYIPRKLKYVKKVTRPTTKQVKKKLMKKIKEVKKTQGPKPQTHQPNTNTTVSPAIQQQKVLAKAKKQKRLNKKNKQSSFLEISKDPIVKGTQFVNGQLVQVQPPMYSQSIGTEVLYGSSPKLCPYTNGIPSCETKFVIPNTFTSEEHQSYYNMNMSFCK